MAQSPFGLGSGTFRRDTFFLEKAEREREGCCLVQTMDTMQTKGREATTREHASQSCFKAVSSTGVVRRQPPTLGTRPPPEK